MYELNYVEYLRQIIQTFLGVSIRLNNALIVFSILSKIINLKN